MTIGAEKIIADLEYYRVHPNIAGMEHYGETIVSIPESLLDDILFALRCEQPRVLTLEEVLESDVVYAEDVDKEEVIPVIVGFLFYHRMALSRRADIDEKDFGTLIMPNVREYLSRWRCWSACPTNEQRKSTPWETKGE